MTRLRVTIVCCAVTLIATACRGEPDPKRAALTAEAFARAEWSQVLDQARGSTVSFAMWAGDGARNSFFQGTVARAVATELGVTLRMVPVADPADVVNKLLNEQRAGRVDHGTIDLVWINGENFRTAKQAGVLWGPFADRLPNIRYYDPADRRADFGTPTEGYEAPWEYAQFVFAYDSARMAAPPSRLPDLKAWIQAHPGRFTYPAIPDFTGSAFIRHVLFHASGAPRAAFDAGFDEALYARASSAAIDWLREVRPSLWRQGDTYPATPADLNRLFVNGEINFSMDYNPAFASDRIARGEFPGTVRTMVLDEGTLTNYSFLAIPFNAANRAGAVAVTNYLLSPAHAFSRMREMGGVFPLMLEPLSPSERQTLASLAAGPATLPLEVLTQHRIREADVQYLLRFERDWRREILER